MRKQYTAVIINDIKVVNRDPTILENTSDLSFYLKYSTYDKKLFFSLSVPELC